MQVFLASLLLSQAALAVPGQFTHQGRLLDADGMPLEDDVTITFRLTAAETGGDVLWEEPLTVSLTNGFYSAILGADEEGNPIDIEVLSQAPVWLELQLDGEPAMFPRSPVHSVPYAAMATVAEEVAGGPVDAETVAVGGVPVINEAGEWVGPGSSVSWSDIEGMPEDFADGVDDDTHSDSLAELATSCVDGDIPVWDAVVEAWACDFDQDTLAGIGCLDGQLIHWSGDSMGWVCADDVDTFLTEEDVDSMVADNGYAMASEVFSGSFLDLVDVPAGLDDGDDDTQRTDGDIRGVVAAEALDMAAGTTMGGVDIATTADLSSPSWLTLADIPSDFADGVDNDTDSFAELGTSCSDGGVPSWDGVLGSWACGSVSDSDTLSDLDCTTGQLASFDSTLGAWACTDPAGVGGTSGLRSTAADLTVGESNGGDPFVSLDTPLSIPDDNTFGVTSTRYVAAADTVETISVDIEVTHGDMSQITVVLGSPTGTEITLYSEGEEGAADLNTNIGWITAPSTGDLYSFFDENPVGTWTLQVIDTGAETEGTLDSWTLRINEEWDGTAFVGESLTVQGTAEVRGQLTMAAGAPIVFSGVDGDETMQIGPDTGTTLYKLAAGCAGGRLGATSLNSTCTTQVCRTHSGGYYVFSCAGRCNIIRSGSWSSSSTSGESCSNTRLGEIILF